MESSRYIPTTEVPPELTNASLRKMLREAHGEIYQLRETNAKLAAALKPFAEECAEWDLDGTENELVEIAGKGEETDFAKFTTKDLWNAKEVFADAGKEAVTK